MPNEVVIITQARMTSTRLPGKILMRAVERTLLETHLDRLADVGVPVIVATTTGLPSPTVPSSNSAPHSTFRYFVAVRMTYWNVTEDGAVHTVRARDPRERRTARSSVQT